MVYNIADDDEIQKEPESDLLSPMKKPSVHSFLFGSDFTSIDSLGRVMILSVPLFSLTKNSTPQNNIHLEDLQTSCDIINHVFTTPVKSDDDLLESSRRNITETPLADTESTDSKVAELSPRLTNLIMSGVVPESPIDNSDYKVKDNPTMPEIPISLVQNKNNEGEIQNNSSENYVSVCKFVGETRTPVTKLSDDISSKDWMLSSGEKSISQPKSRLKRLRKYGDIKSGNLSDVEEVVGHRSCAQLDRFSNKRGRGNFCKFCYP